MLQIEFKLKMFPCAEVTLEGLISAGVTLARARKMSAIWHYKKHVQYAGLQFHVTVMLLYCLLFY